MKAYFKEIIEPKNQRLYDLLFSRKIRVVHEETPYKTVVLKDDYRPNSYSVVFVDLEKKWPAAF